MNQVSPAPTDFPTYATPPSSASGSVRGDRSLSTAITNGESIELPSMRVSPHVIIEMPESENRPSVQGGYSDLTSYWKFVLWTPIGHAAPWKKPAAMLQTVLWGLLIVLAATDSFGFLKSPIIDLKNPKNADKVESKVTEAGMRLVQLGLNLRFMQILFQDKGKVMQLLEMVNGMKIKTIAFKNFSYLLFTFSMGLSVLFTIVGFEVIRINSNWKMSVLTWYQFENMYNLAWNWSPKALMVPEDVSDRAFYPAVCLGYFSTFGSLITLFVWQDIFLITACLLQKNMEHLSSMMEEYRDVENSTRDVKFQKAYAILKMHNSLHNFSKKVNKIFGPVFELMEANYIFVAVLLMYRLIKDFDVGSIIVLLCGLVKFWITYSKCVSASEETANFEDWLNEKEVRQILSLENDDLNIILRGLDQSPIGIGRGEHYINRQFVSKMAGKAVMYFVVLYKFH